MPKSTLQTSLFFILSIFLHLSVISIILWLPHLFNNSSKKKLPITIVQVVAIKQPKARPIPQKKEIKKQNPIPKQKKQPTAKPKPKSVKKKQKLKKEKKTSQQKTTKIESKKDSVQEAKNKVPAKTKISTQDHIHPKLKLWIKRVGRLWDTHWNPPSGIGILGTVEGEIQATILRSGHITKIKLIHSSKNSLLDEQAKGVLTRIGRFPPIPANYRDKNQLTINFIYKYYGDKKK